MRINKVKIENFCQHHSREDVFEPGLTGVIGPNGSGKSNYIKALLFALTGVSGNFGKKEEDLSWGADTGKVTVEFYAHGAVGTITRHIKSAKCQMTLGEKKWTSAKQVEEAIFEFLGVNVKLLREMVFVPQGEIERLLFEAPAERARSFQVLFGTAGAETIRALLQVEVQELSLYGEQNKQHYETCLGEIDVAKARVEKVKGDVEQLRKSIVSPEDQKKWREQVNELRLIPAQARARAELETRVNNLFKSVRETKERQVSVRSKVQELESVVNDVREMYTSAKKELGDVKAWRVAKQQREQLSSREVSLQEALKARAEPQYENRAVRLEVCRKYVQQISPTVSTAREIVKLFKPGVRNVCPTCKQEVGETFLQEQEAVVQQHGPAMDKTAQEIEWIEMEDRKYDRDMASHRSWTESARRELVGIQGQLASLPAPAQEQVDLAALEAQAQEIVTMYESVSSDLERERAVLPYLERTLQESEPQLVKYEQELAAAPRIEAERLAAVPLQVSALEAQLARASQVEVSVASAVGELSGLERGLAGLLERAEKLRASLVGAEEIAQWRGLVERARAVLHRDQLPLIVAQAYIEALNPRIENYLGLFEAKYTAKILPDLSIECRFGTNALLAERLSGGQKIELALAFRLAVYDLFAAGLGLLVLDEPTVYLDTDRIDRVCQLMQKIKSYSASAGLQVIVVTHEARLAGVCDRVVSM